MFEVNRHLGALELLFYTWDLVTPKHFLLAAEIEGATNIVDWKNGILALQRRHPMLRVGIAHTSESIVFTSTSDAIRFETFPYTIETNIREALQDELAQPVRPLSGPLVRAVLYHSNDRCLLILTVHHSVADGLSSLHLMNDLLRSVAGSDLHELPVRPSLDGLLNQPDQDLTGNVLSQLSGKQTTTENALQREIKPQIDLLTLPKDLTAKIISRSKAEHSSVHAALQAAAIQSISALTARDGAPVRIMSPIATRSHLDLHNECGSYTIAATIPFSDTHLKTFWQLAREAKEALAPWSSKASTEAYGIQLNQLVGSVPDLAGFMESNLQIEVMLSNLGLFPFPDHYGPLKLRNVYGPMIVSGAGNQQSVGAITVDGRLNLTSSSRYLIPELLTDMSKRLIAACA